MATRPYIILSPHPHLCVSDLMSGYSCLTNLYLHWILFCSSKTPARLLSKLFFLSYFFGSFTSFNCLHLTFSKRLTLITLYNSNLDSLIPAFLLIICTLLHFFLSPYYSSPFKILYDLFIHLKLFRPVLSPKNVNSSRTRIHCLFS